MTLATHTPVDWNDILSTTAHNISKKLEDNIFNKRPLLQHLMSNGRVKTVGGGISLVETLLFQEGDADSYGEWDVVAVEQQATATAAQYNWALLKSTIAISGLEEAQNNGREQAIDLLEGKFEQSEGTLRTRLNQMLFGTKASPLVTDFACVDPGGTPVYGIPGYIALKDQTLGGIVDEDFWESIVAAEVGNATLDGAGLEKVLRDSYNLSSDSGDERVDAIFTNAYGFGFYESTLTPQVRYTDTAKANLGFQNLMFKDVPIMWDFDCSGGTEGTKAADSASFYGINSKTIGLKIHRDRNFKQSPFTENLAGSTIPNAAIGSAPSTPGTVAGGLDARVSYITTYGNLCMRNRRRNFKVTGVAEA